MAPHVDGIFLEPEEAAKKGLCPECGNKIRAKDIEAHARAHWGDDLPNNATTKEAQKRRALLLSMTKAAKGATADAS